jgi:thiol-disulfide isomerase/thioredoxin
VKPLFSLAASIFLAASVVHSATAETSDSLESILKSAGSKPVVLEFTGSDWCPPCMQMEKKVFSTQEFKDFAEKDIVFVKLDFPNSREQEEAVKERNAALSKQSSIEGYPTLVVLSSSGKELGRQVGFMGGGATEVISWIKSKANL